MHRNLSLLSLAADGQDEKGLQLEKKIAHFLLCILQKWLKIYYTLIRLLLLGEIISYFSLGALRAISS